MTFDEITIRGRRWPAIVYEFIGRESLYTRGTVHDVDIAVGNVITSRR
jgi:hypothetical protein